MVSTERAENTSGLDLETRSGEKFNTYRFADYKEKVIDMLARVTTVSVETKRIVGDMQRARR
jgi:hypothetical protein